MENIIFNPCDKNITQDLQLSRNTIACAQCGSKQRKLGAGRKPGEASLLCECGKFIKWVAGSQLKAIAAQLNKQGGQG